MGFENDAGTLWLNDGLLGASGPVSQIGSWYGAASFCLIEGGTVVFKGTSGNQVYFGNNLAMNVLHTNNTGIVDLVGNSQVMSGLQSGIAAGPGGGFAGFYTNSLPIGDTNIPASLGILTNSGSQTSYLILNGGSTFYGSILEGPTGKIAIVKSNTGTQFLYGTNAFTGGLYSVPQAATPANGGTLNYGRGEPNTPIFNYPVNPQGSGTINFNVRGDYLFA